MLRQHASTQSPTIRVAVGLSCLLLTLSGCTDEPSAPGVMDRIQAVTDLQDDNNHESNVDPESGNVKPTVSATGPWPKAVVEETDYYFGHMNVGTRNHHTFSIMNDGEAPLELVPGKATCKCTEFRLDKQKIEPGESASVFIEWHGKFADEQFQHGGPVFTNDPGQPEIRFYVRGVVDALYGMQPAGLWNAGDISGDEPVTFHGQLFSTVFDTLTIEDVSSETGLATVEFSPMSSVPLQLHNARSGWIFAVTVHPGDSSGIQKDTLSVVVSELDDPIEIPVQARRLGAIRFAPMRGTSFSDQTNTIDLGQFPAGKGRKGSLMLLVERQGLEDEFQLTDVEADSGALKVSIEPIGEATAALARYRLVVEVPPGRLRDSRDKTDAATIQCSTNHPTEKQFQLQVVFRSF